MPKALATATHTWVAAFNLRLSDEDAAGVVEAKDQIRLYGTNVDILDVYCADCRRPYTDVADEPCAVAVSNEHLRGGPENGARRKRRCDRHAMLYKECGHLHEEPLTYGRPPLPRMDRLSG